MSNAARPSGWINEMLSVKGGELSGIFSRPTADPVGVNVTWILIY